MTTTSEATNNQALLVDLLERMSKAGSWTGETHLQKCVYFLQEMTTFPKAFQFVLYKHGPHSFDLHDELANMVANQTLVIEHSTTYGPTFGPGPYAQRLKQRCTAALAQHEATLDFAAHSLSPNDTGDLEMWGTAFYISKQNPNIAKEEQAIVINQLKPHIPFEEAMQALSSISYLEQQVQTEFQGISTL